MNRRGFLKGMAGILASGFAPAVVGSNILMPVKTIFKPEIIGIDFGGPDESVIQLMRVIDDANEYAEELTRFPYINHPKAAKIWSDALYRELMKPPSKIRLFFQEKP